MAENLDQSLQTPQETIGKRIARLRSERGWTQQALANRLAISRVAVSHIEMDLTIPSERTVILLAGLFRLSPHKLVAATTYPLAKAERLPATTLCYTDLELELALLENDLSWLKILAESRSYSETILQNLEMWSGRLERLTALDLDESESGRLDEARRMIRTLHDHLLEI